MPWSHGRRSFRKNEKKRVNSYENAWLLLTFLKARGWSGHISPLAPALGLQLKKMAMSPMSPSSPVHGGQYDTKYVTLE